MLVWIVIVVIIIIGLITWIGSQSQAPAPAASGPTGAIKTLTLNTATDPTLGTILVASNGMTLYRFTKDTVPAASACYGSCATLWPAYIVSSDASLQGGGGATGAITTITRTDGTLQATYNGQPLYFWHNDAAPGDVNGQGVGGVWFVVNP